MYRTSSANKQSFQRLLNHEYNNEIPDNELRIFDEDIILIGKETGEPPFKIDEELEYLVTDLIKDKEKTEGRQTWIVKVIGKTQYFIHVLDKGRRSWVDVKGFEDMINRNDYLKLDVLIQEKGTKIKAKKIVKLHPVK